MASACVETERINVSTYLQTTTSLLSSPIRFFSDVPAAETYKRAGTYLMVSAIFYTVASYAYFFNQSLTVGAIILVNALAMPFVTGFLAYIFSTMFYGKKISMPRMFSIFAYSSGVVMIISWIPALVWVTEPWRGLLCLVGLVKAGELKWHQAIIVMGCTIISLLVLIWSFLPVARAIGTMIR